MNNIVISAKNLTKTFDGLTAVHHISFEVNVEEFDKLWQGVGTRSASAPFK